MILAKGYSNTQWDGKRATLTAGELFRKPVRRTQNRFTLLLVVVIFVGGLGVGRIALDNRIAIQCAQLEDLQDRELLLRTENDKMQQKIRSSIQLKNMEKIAQQRLKMVKPDIQQMMFIRHLPR